MLGLFTRYECFEQAGEAQTRGNSSVRGGFRGLGIRGLGFWGFGFRDLGFTASGVSGLGLRGLGF